MKQIAKKLIATLTALSLLAALCFSTSAATKVDTNGNIGYIGADATAQTLTYAYDELVAKDFNGNDYDYGSFEEEKNLMEIENTTRNFGLKALLGWKVASGADGVTVQTVSDSHSGNYAMQFTNTVADNASVLQLYPALGNDATSNTTADIKGLVPYGNYQFTFWYKGSGDKILKVHYYTNVTNVATEIVTPYTCIEVWQQASINIMADSAGTIKLWFDFGEEVSGGQYVCLDDVAFYRCGVGTDGSVNLFGDDGFESTVTGDFEFTQTYGKWMYIKDAAGNYTHFSRSQDAADNGTTFTMGVSEDTAHTGKKSLKIVSNDVITNTNSPYTLKLRPQYVYYNYSDAKLVPAQNGYYTLSFWVKGDPAVYGIYVNAGSASNNYKFSIFKNAEERISVNEWRQVTVRSIPATEGYIYADIQINLYGTADGAQITPLYLDDIQLVRQTNYIENGNFENQEVGITTSVDGFTYDNTLANNTIEITNDSISGEKALKITQNANGETSYGGVLSADGILANAGVLEDMPAGDYLVSVWSKGASKPYFQYGPTTGADHRGRIGDNGDTWKLNTFTISISDTVTPNIKISFLAAANYIGASLYLDDLRYETVDDAKARIIAILDAFNIKTATANEIEYLRQWVNYYKDDLDTEKIKAFRLSIGDVTNNGTFDSGDISRIRDYLIGNITGVDAGYDINGDTVANIRDLVRAVSIPRV